MFFLSSELLPLFVNCSGSHRSGLPWKCRCCHVQLWQGEFQRYAVHSTCTKV